MDEERRAPATTPALDGTRALARLNIARQQKDLTVSKSRVCPRKPMYHLPALAIRHHRRFAAGKAASHQQLKRWNTDSAGPTASLCKKFNPARVDPVLRVLISFHFGLIGASMVSEQKCGVPPGRLPHQKTSSALVCTAGSPLWMILGDARNEECGP
jgi:hypothetical protein